MNIGSLAACPRRYRLRSASFSASWRTGNRFNLLKGSAALLAKQILKVLTLNRLHVLSEKKRPRMRCCISFWILARRPLICHLLTLLSNRMMTACHGSYAATLAATYIANSYTYCRVCSHLGHRYLP